MQQLPAIEEKVRSALRISRAEAQWLWQNATDEDCQRLATIVRGRFHPPGRATYLVMRIINYTNICVAKCDYCAFYRLPRSTAGYLLPNEVIFQKIEELIDRGGDLVGFNGGFNPRLRIDYYIDLFGEIRRRYGDKIEFYAMTVVELLYVARLSRLTALEAARQLKGAGVRWITGGGAEILADTFRVRHSPLKYTVQEYLDTQRAILEAGLSTTATMVIGFDESLGERLDHLDRIRGFQDETGGLFSFLCWTYKPYHTDLGGIEISPAEYLRHLALSRLYLDNVRHIRASVLTQNALALKGLHYGADDFDIPLEDEVTQKAGAIIERDIERVLDHARAEGFEPVYRHVGRQAVPA